MTPRSGGGGSSGGGGGSDLIGVRGKETFDERMKRERREARVAIERKYAREARRCLWRAMEPTDPNVVLDAKVTQADLDLEERKLKYMAASEKEAYLAEKAWERAKAVVAERDGQRARMRRAVHELWLLELHQVKPAEAAQAMATWLGMARGQPERMAALTCLHESLSLNEHLLGADYSVAHHAVKGSLGELGDLHLAVLQALLDAQPDEPHYKYALARLEQKRLPPERSHGLSRRLMEGFVDSDAATSGAVEGRRAVKSEAFYHNRADERGRRLVDAYARVDALGHWQVQPRQSVVLLLARFFLYKRAGFISLVVEPMLVRSVHSVHSASLCP